MRIVLSISSVLLLLISNALSQKVDLAKELQSLVKAERAFARMAAETTTRTAFLANMTDDAIVFGPEGAQNGKKVWTERPERPGLLSWEPVYADVARAGDIGYTTGPWEFRPEGAKGKPAGFGQFVTVWTKQPDGGWKWVLDVGVSHPAPVASPPSLSFPKDFRKNTDKDKLDNEIADVEKEALKAEREFLNASKSDSRKAFSLYAHEEIRLLREGSYPANGKEAALKTFADAQASLTCETLGSGASRSGDLAYTYGKYETRRRAASETSGDANATERGSYARIWKRGRDGKWKIALDLQNPFPPRAS